MLHEVVGCGTGDGVGTGCRGDYAGDGEDGDVRGDGHVYGAGPGCVMDAVLVMMLMCIFYCYRFWWWLGR